MENAKKSISSEKLIEIFKEKDIELSKEKAEDLLDLLYLLAKLVVDQNFL